MIRATRPPIAWGYRRFSSKPQELGDSQRRQDCGLEQFTTSRQLPLRALKLDRGVSAFTGRNLTHGELGRFLKAIQEGEVLPGDFLVVESIDRLSRQEAMKSLNLLDQIVSAGITLVCLAENLEIDSARLRDDESTLLMFVFGAIRSNRESKLKSQRCCAAWGAKKEMAKKDGTPTTSKGPGWLKLVDGKWQFVKTHQATIKRIVRMGIEGLGADSICKTLNREKVPTFSRKGTTTWSISTIRFLLNSKSLIGYKQNWKMVNGKQTPDGEPFKAFPSVISEAEFYKLQSVLATRRNKVRGRAGNNVPNLFGAILKSGHDGATIVLSQKHQPNGKNIYYLVSSAAKTGISDYQSFQYQPFEEGFLKWVSEIELNKADKQENVALDVLKGKLADVQGKLAKVNQRIDESDAGGLDHFLNILEKLSAEEKKLKGDIEAEKSKQHRPIIRTTDVAQFVKQLKGLRAEEQTAIRARLRQSIQSLCSEIKVYIYAKGARRVLFAHVQMADGVDRIFAVLKRRGQPVEAISDTLKWDGKSMKGMNQFFDTMAERALNEN